LIEDCYINTEVLLYEPVFIINKNKDGLFISSMDNSNTYEGGYPGLVGKPFSLGPGFPTGY